MAIATKKIKHDIYDGEVAIRPRAFVISGSGNFTDVPTTFEPVGFTGTQADYFQYVATASNAPFLPAVGGRAFVDGVATMDAGNSLTSSPGINPYSYRRIPFVHKIGGSNQISTVGNASIAEEIIRYNLYGKAGDISLGKLEWQTPFSAATIQFVVFPFGRSAPSDGETNSFQAADNFVHARGNLAATTYFRQRYTWLTVQPNMSSGGVGTGPGAGVMTVYSGSGDPNGTYTEVQIDVKHLRPTGIMIPLKPDVIFNNSPAAYNDLAANSSVGSAGIYSYNGDPSNVQVVSDTSGLVHGGSIMNPYVTPHPKLCEIYPVGHPHAGKAKFYDRTPFNPLTGIADGNGPITHDGNDFYPVNRWVGTNTTADPNTPNSNVTAHFTHGHQGDTTNGDMSLGFRAASAGLIVKGLLEIY